MITPSRELLLNLQDISDDSSFSCATFGYLCVLFVPVTSLFSFRAHYVSTPAVLFDELSQEDLRFSALLLPKIRVSGATYLADIALPALTIVCHLLVVS